jgi:hypothetical protein
MSEFRIGDKVRIEFGRYIDKTGIIVDEAPTVTSRAATPGRPRPDGPQIHFWKVKIVGTVIEDIFPEEYLKKIE